MKALLAISALLAVGCLSSIAGARDTYAPQLKDVVVMFDSAERDFSPFLFHDIMSMRLDMPMDPSCQQVQVIQIHSRTSVICVSETGAKTEAGVLTGKTRGRDGFWIAKDVEWNDQVKIVAHRTRDNGVSYSLSIK